MAAARGPTAGSWMWSGPSAGGIRADDSATGVDPRVRVGRPLCDGFGVPQEAGVDIGSRIKKGEVLAEIDVPHDAKAVEQEAARRWSQARDSLSRAEAQIKMAEAQRDAVAAAVRQAESDIDRLVALRELARSNCPRPGSGRREARRPNGSSTSSKGNSTRRWPPNGPRGSPS